MGKAGSKASGTCMLFSCLMIMLLYSSSYSAPAADSVKQPAACGERTGPLPNGVKTSEKVYGMPGLSNVGRLNPCIFRGNQPVGNGYITLKEFGIKTVINLRSRHGERQAVEAQGMSYLEFPLGMTERVRKDIVRKAVAAMADPANHPVYVHCALGQDRTGIVVAAYRMEIEGWSLEEAEKEMQSFGFNDAWVHLKKFIRSYQKEKSE